MKTAVIYVFHQFDRNVRFFLRHGMVSDDTVDYYIVENHAEWEFGHPVECTEKSLGQSGVKWIHRANVANDWGAYSEAVRQMDPKNYEHFVFVNSSMRGPFLPPWYDGKQHWANLFTQKLNNSVALVGSSINWWHGNPHVQSMLMAMDNRAFTILREHDVIMSTDKIVKKDDLILMHEVESSRLVIEAGYNIDCMITALQGKDWRLKDQKFQNMHMDHTDFWGHRQYFGHDLHPYEVIFFKTNRTYDDRFNITNMMTGWFEHIESPNDSSTVKHTAEDILDPDDYISDKIQGSSIDEKVIMAVIAAILAVGMVTFFVLWQMKKY